MVAEVAGERVLQHAKLGAQAATGELGQHLGIPLTRDQGGHHGPAGDSEAVSRHHA